MYVTRLSSDCRLSERCRIGACGAPSLCHSTPTIKHQFYQFSLITLTLGDLFIPTSQSNAKHFCFLCVKSQVQIPAPTLSTSTDDFTVLLSPSMPQPFPSLSLPLHYSIIILLPGATDSVSIDNVSKWTEKNQWSNKPRSTETVPVLQYVWYNSYIFCTLNFNMDICIKVQRKDIKNISTSNSSIPCNILVSYS